MDIETQEFLTKTIQRLVNVTIRNTPICLVEDIQDQLDEIVSSYDIPYDADSIEDLFSRLVFIIDTLPLEYRKIVHQELASITEDFSVQTSSREKILASETSCELMELTKGFFPKRFHTFVLEDVNVLTDLYVAMEEEPSQEDVTRDLHEIFSKYRLQLTIEEFYDHVFHFFETTLPERMHPFVKNDIQEVFNSLKDEGKDPMKEELNPYLAKIYNTYNADMTDEEKAVEMSKSTVRFVPSVPSVNEISSSFTSLGAIDLSDAPPDSP